MPMSSLIPDVLSRGARLLVALAWLGAGGALAQEPDPEVLEEVDEGVVRHFMVSTPSGVDLVATREQLEVELRAWGLDVSNCDYLRQLDTELDAEIAERYPQWRFDQDLVQDKQMLAARCLPPAGSAVYYIVKVSLDVDEEFGGQKRANVQLLPIGEQAAGRREFYGGYAHRPFAERATWSEVIARAIQRAIGGLDEPPSLHIEGGTRTQVGKPILFDAGESWDPDGDPFRIEWSATVPACRREVQGKERIYPRIGKGCARRAEPVEQPVQMRAGETSRDRKLAPAIVGVHTVTATPVAGPKVVGEAVTREVKVTPATRTSSARRSPICPFPAASCRTRPRPPPGWSAPSTTWPAIRHARARPLPIRPCGRSPGRADRKVVRASVLRRPASHREPARHPCDAAACG